MWAEKYRPKSEKELEGQELAVLALKNFLKNFKKQDKKAVLVYGPSGCGKNSLVNALAKELNYDVIEFNASQLRDAKEIKEILKPATQQQSLFGKGSIIFIDEAEAFTWLDRGGLSAMVSLLTETKWPIIFAAGNLWDKKLNELRRKVQQIEIRKLDYSNILKILERVCKKENLNIEKSILEKIALKAMGDARGAINDLQSLAFTEINEKMLDSLGEREKEASIFNALSLIFKTKDAKAALEAFDNVNLPLDECILWLDENLPLEYSEKELEKAYGVLSKADIFRKRIMKRRHWRFLVYINALVTAGVATAKKEGKKEYVSYKRLSRLLKIWMAKQKNLKRKGLAEKLAKAMHCSFRKAYKELPLFEMIFRNSDKSELVHFSKNLRLNERETEYLASLG
ncbi:hypothetical protein B6U80_02190 [Candidatus Pacearchaeota archaeon ex4484_26]|nr:MAG: hypothetical protein B6U80_02190 [Candidatus Pacearchaeota archaeon ex4484_26]